MTEDLLILGELIAEQAAHMDAAEHRLLTNIRDFDAREGWVSAMSCAHWLAWRVGWSLGTAREHVRVAKALGTLPHIDEALRLGKVSYCKVRAMTRVATPLNEQVLLMDAGLTTGSQLERICRKYKQLKRLAAGAKPEDDDLHRYVTRRDLDTGMVRITAVLHPEEAALVWAALDKATKDLLGEGRAAKADDAPSSFVPIDVSAEPSISTASEPSQSVSVETSCATTIATRNGSFFDVATHSANAERRSQNVSAETSSATTTATSSGSSVDDSTHSANDERRSCNVSAETSTSSPSRRPSHISEETSTRGHVAEAAARCDGSSTTSELCVADEANDDDQGVCEGPRSISFYDAVFGEEDDYRDSSRNRSFDGGEYYDDDKASDDSTDEAIDEASESYLPHASAHQLTSTQSHQQPAALDQVKRKPRFNRADGLVALARRFACGDSSRTPVEIVVTVPAAALQQTASPEESIAFLGDGGCINAETARRLACDAAIVYMVEDAHGQPLTVGRRTRSIPTSIRRAMLHRDKTCRFPGCTNRLYVEGHHIEHWASGGETALPNLLSLCGYHHTFVHEYNYRIELDTTGAPSFFDDRGRPVKDVPTRYWREDLGWEHIHATNRELEIAPHVCGWNGEPVQYPDVCRALYRLDEGTLKPEDIC